MHALEQVQTDDAERIRNRHPGQQILVVERFDDAGLHVCDDGVVEGEEEHGGDEREDGACPCELALGAIQRGSAWLSCVHGGRASVGSGSRRWRGGVELNVSCEQMV